MIQSVLNTQTYLSGAPFDKKGDDTYVLAGWAEDAVLSRLIFARDQGDASMVRIEIYDRDAEVPEAVKLFEDTFEPVARRIYEEPIELRGSKKNRLHVRLIALDGEEQNHCKIVFYGEPLA